MVSSCSPFKALELLADPPGEVFRHKTALYERIFEPFCKIMDTQLQKGTILGKNDIFRKYTDIVRWPIRKLEYSFVLQHTLPLLEGRPHQRVLDAGCGVTPLPHLFAMMGAEVDAVDFNEEVIETLKTERVNGLYGYPVNHQSMDLRRLAFPDSTFDIVMCVSVIEQLDNGDEGLVLAEIARVLKPGGKAILTTDVRGGDDGPAKYKDRRYDEPFYWRTLEGLLASYAEMVEGGLGQLQILNELQDDAIKRFWASHGNPESTWQGNRGYVALGIVLSKPQTAVRTECSSGVGSEGGRLADVKKPHNQSGESDAIEILLKSQIRRSIELERALEEKEKVIRELHSEAELRREKLEEMAADRDSWEARYQQVAAEAELRRERLEELERTLRQARTAWGKEPQALSEELRTLQSEYEAILKSPIHYFRKVWQQRMNKRRDESG